MLRAWGLHAAQGPQSCAPMPPPPARWPARGPAWSCASESTLPHHSASERPLQLRQGRQHAYPQGTMTALEGLLNHPASWPLQRRPPQPPHPEPSARAGTRPRRPPLRPRSPGRRGRPPGSPTIEAPRGSTDSHGACLAAQSSGSIGSTPVATAPCGAGIHRSPHRLTARARVRLTSLRVTSLSAHGTCRTSARRRASDLHRAPRHTVYKKRAEHPQGAHSGPTACASRPSRATRRDRHAC